jgi:hypothetical protein
MLSIPVTLKRVKIQSPHRDQRPLINRRPNEPECLPEPLHDCWLVARRESGIGFEPI